MKYSRWIIFVFMSMLGGSASSFEKNEGNLNTENKNMISNKIKIKVNSQVFTATLLDNNSAKEFKKMLPLTININELNGDEKYYNLPKSLPTNSPNSGTIKNGDLMLYGSKTFVLFYKTHSTSYSYTKLGVVRTDRHL